MRAGAGFLMTPYSNPALTHPIGSAATTSASEARRRYLVLGAAVVGWMFDGLEMGIFPLVARPALLQMTAVDGVVSESVIGRWMGIITALFLVGAALGGLLFGWLGDKVGRVRAMSFSILCYSLFTGLAYFARSPAELGAARFLSALGMGGEWSLGVALVMEVWPEKNRPFLAGVIGAASNVGFALIAVLGLVFEVTPQSWRFVMLVGAAPALLTFAIRLFVPESERWTESQAKATSRPLREIVVSPILGRTVMATILAGVVLIGTWGSVQWLPLWADRMAGASAPHAKAVTLMVSAVGSIFGCLVGAWMGARFGRRPAYFLLCLTSLLSCAWLFRGVENYGGLFLGLTFVVGGVTASFFGWLPLYLPELFPTRVRATAQGIAFNAGRILAAVGALQMGALMRVFGGSYAQAAAVITLIYLVGMVAIWFVPETKNQPLPE